MKIGFALITEKLFLDEIVSKEETFHDRAGFTDRLGEDVNLPHITIFQGDFISETDYQSIAESLADAFVRLFPDRTVCFTGVEYVPDGWYFFVCQKTDAFSELHMFALDKVKSCLQVGSFTPDLVNDRMTSDQIAGIRDYGYRYSGPAFFPHITLGRSSGLDSEILKDLNVSFKDMPQQAEISRITVYRMGNNGTHSETLYEIKL